MSAMILQANLNHACQAQDLFLHTLAERGCEIGIVAEPYRPPAGVSNWYTDQPSGGKNYAAIIWRRCRGFSPCCLVRKGTGYVAVRWGDTLVVGVYYPPSDTARFIEQLEEIGEVVRAHLPGSILVAGDLNAKSASWGCPRIDRRGDSLKSGWQGTTSRF